uniref:Uncharacterized protein n=1 Tax=Kalanchoe fedtschenkoi TaxID=63787 RepID=A0A7N0U3I4_KALFE
MSLWPETSVETKHWCCHPRQATEILTGGKTKLWTDFIVRLQPPFRDQRPSLPPGPAQPRPDNAPHIPSIHLHRKSNCTKIKKGAYECAACLNEFANERTPTTRLWLPKMDQIT